MCFGAAFIASNQSASFKVRKVYLTQHPVKPLSIRISPANASKVSQEGSADEQETVSNEVNGGEDEPNQEGAAPAQTASGITYNRTY
jgi:hypothetical protein